MKVRIEQYNERGECSCLTMGPAVEAGPSLSGRYLEGAGSFVRS
jgi:hypothetical protein